MHDAVSLAIAVVWSYVAEFDGAEHLPAPDVIWLSSMYGDNPDPEWLRTTRRTSCARLSRATRSICRCSAGTRTSRFARAEAEESWGTYGACDLIRTVVWPTFEVCEHVTVRVEAEQPTDGSLI